MTTKQFICGIIGHRRVRRQVWNDGTQWRCACHRCQAPLAKDARSGRWEPIHDTVLLNARGAS